jgi:siroheme synthase
VVLVGAGPGDPELITVKGLGWLRRAEVVVYDRLVAPALLEEVPAAALRIYAGKSRGRHCIPQSAISPLLVRHAEAGRLVVRLKGGDPFVFGRGGEEVLIRRAAGIPWRWCRHLSAIAAPAAVGSLSPIAGRLLLRGGHGAWGLVGWRRRWTGGLAAAETLVVLGGGIARPSPRD